MTKQTNKKTISATKITSLCSNNIWKEHFWTLYDISAWYWPLNFEKGPRKKSTWTTNTIPVRVTINQFLWTIDLVKRELNIFRTESYTDFEKNENHELFCPKNSVKSMCSNQLLRKKFYLLIPTTRFTLLDWRKCHNNVKPFVEYSKKETFDTEKKDRIRYDNRYVFESKYCQTCCWYLAKIVLTSSEEKKESFLKKRKDLLMLKDLKTKHVKSILELLIDSLRIAISIIN